MRDHEHLRKAGARHGAIVWLTLNAGTGRTGRKAGSEHHGVMTQSHSAEILAEAFGNYFGWEVYRHEANQ